MLVRGEATTQAVGSLGDLFVQVLRRASEILPSLSVQGIGVDLRRMDFVAVEVLEGVSLTRNGQSMPLAPNRAIVTPHG